jgi:hypothetical protein
VARLDAWIESEGFRGWDPFDALNSRALKALAFGSRRLGQLSVQALKRCPINVRPLLGIPKGYNPKGMGLFLASYWRKYQMSKEARHLERVNFLADWLHANVVPGYHGACWGYNFDWPNRAFFALAGTPTIVNTACIGLAFMDLARGDESRALGAPALLTARSACDFILSDLRTEQPAADELCFSYTPIDSRYIHNANVLGAWLLAEVAAQTSEKDLAKAALASARYTARRQRSDGAWRYGEAANEGWVDNFHTGYVLMALKRLGSCLRTDEFAACVSKGYRFWKTHMFTPEVVPKYYASKLHPIDSHCVAVAVLTFLAFADEDVEARPLAAQSAEWGIAHLQNPAGYFDYQITPSYRVRIPYMRWTQAWMQRALTELCATAPSPNSKIVCG